MSESTSLNCYGLGFYGLTNKFRIVKMNEWNANQHTRAVTCCNRVMVAQKIGLLTQMSK